MADGEDPERRQAGHPSYTRPFSHVIQSSYAQGLSSSPNRYSDSRFFFSERRLSQLFDVEAWLDEDGEGSGDLTYADDAERDPPPEPAPRASYCPPSPTLPPPGGGDKSRGGYSGDLHEASMYSAMGSAMHLDARYSAEMARLSSLTGGSGRFSTTSSLRQDNGVDEYGAHGDVTPTPGSPTEHAVSRRSHASPSCYSQVSHKTDDSRETSLSSGVPSSLPSVLSELAGEVGVEALLLSDQEDDKDIIDGPGPLVWGGPEVNWQERCLELELSLQRFRDQAGKIRELLREKLAELEQRVVEAESRADEAEEKVRAMEQRLEWKAALQGREGSGGTLPGDPTGTGTVSADREAEAVLSELADEFIEKEKEEVITTLASQVAEQRQLRLQDAKKVEAKAAKIKEWVTNKLKELEEQNTVLREQNAKCNVQLELLRGRLAHLSTLHGKDKDADTELKWKRRSLSLPKDSSRGSYEGDRLGSDESLVDDPRNAGDFVPSRPATLGRDHRSKTRSPGALRRTSSSDTDTNYADLRLKGSRFNGPQRLANDDKHRSRESRVDSGSVDLETPQSLSPKSPLEAMLNSLTQSTNSLPRSCSPRSGGNKNDSPRKPVPQPRTKHLKKKGNVQGAMVSKSTDSLDFDLDLYDNADSSDSSQLACSGDSHLDEDDAGRTRGKDEGHDYSEIYTPSRDQGNAIMGWTCDREGKPGEGDKPPTPPLHRFPSWESRIYQVAQEGLVGAGGGGGADAGEGNKVIGSSLGSYPEIHVPVYAAVKGRASQIRSVPFTGDSSDSSDGEEHCGGSDSRGLSSQTPSSSAESSSSSPSKSKTSSLSPAKLSGSSPSKSMRRDTSFESGVSDDYAIPPDARSDSGSLESTLAPTLSARTSCVDPTSNTLSSSHIGTMSPRRESSLEKSGYLTKLGGKLKTWRKRYFVLKDGTLTYWKSQSDVHRKPAGQISLDDACRVTRSEGAHTFEVNTGKKIYYLTADNTALVEDWVRVLQNVLRRNATRLLLSREDNKPTLQGWLNKVKHGHAKRCWCVLIGKMFIYFKNSNDQNPLGQINMRDARVEEVERVSDSEEEEAGDDDTPHEDLTIGIFPSHQGPTYLIMPSKQEKDAWLYHLTIVSGGGPNAGTQYEQLVQKLMELDGDPNCVLWRHPLLLHTKEPITSPLTSLPSSQLQAEAIKLFKSCQLYASVLMDSSGIDYHVVLCQNALQQCLTFPELQSELFCGLIKQTSKHLQARPGVQNLLLCATQSLFLCDSSGAQKASPTLGSGTLPADPKINPPSFTFIQGWQFLSLAVSLFVPKNNKLLWYLKLHLQRNADTKTEIGKYAAYCQRALERTLENGGREAKPSRMEVLSILLKNPYHHSLPHAIPVHFLNNTYQVVGFDGSTTIDEFLTSLNQEICCRDAHLSGFALFSDDPIEKDLEHCLNPNAKLCDVISKWETALREKGSGKFENTKVIRLMYKNRLYWRHCAKHETEKEKLLLCYQVNCQIQQGRFPLTKELALELATLMAQIDMGDVNSERSRGSGSSGPSMAHVQQAFSKFYPQRYRQDLTEEETKTLLDSLQEKWIGLRGRTHGECVRIYLTCTRKWPFFGATLFPAATPTPDGPPNPVWVAVSEEAITLLDYTSMQAIVRYGYSNVVTFGGCQEDFMLVVHTAEEEGHHPPGTHKLLLCMNKPKILELTLLIADYMNALGRPVPGTPQTGTLTRHGSRRSARSHLASTGQPDLLKMTTEVDSKLQRLDAKKRGHIDSSLV
ncbi:uncharacterized protein CG43867 isoform X3 [Oratosquilla oratoria]|uniref:uncharacterized protein CG43867 isoform X3 n=1 Tax=Oratosquilla oratoria TaxID=337810 RepID=UPI003F7648B6